MYVRIQEYVRTYVQTIIHKYVLVANIRSICNIVIQDIRMYVSWYKPVQYHGMNLYSIVIQEILWYEPVQYHDTNLYSIMIQTCTVNLYSLIIQTCNVYWYVQTCTES